MCVRSPCVYIKVIGIVREREKAVCCLVWTNLLRFFCCCLFSVELRASMPIRQEAKSVYKGERKMAAKQK